MRGRNKSLPRILSAIVAFLPGVVFAPLLRAQQVETPPRAIPVTPPALPPRAIPVQPPPPPAQPAASPTEAESPPASPAPRVLPAETVPPGELNPPLGGEVIRLAPGSTAGIPADEVLFRAASGLYQDKLYHLAAPQFEAYLAKFPYGAQREAASFRLAECHREMGRDDLARSLYRRIITEFQRGPFVGSAAYRLAESMVRTNDLEAARSYFELAASHLDDPKLKMAAMFRQARCLEMLGRPESARASYRRLIEIKEENPYREATLLALAQIAEKTGRSKEAFDYYSSLAEDAVKPALRAECAVQAAVLASAQDKPELAGELYKKALAIPVEGPWHGMARLGLLRLDYDAGEYARLIETYEAAPEQFAESLRPEALILVANAHRQLRQFEKAADLYGQVMTDYPNSNFASEAAYQQLVALYSTDDPRLEPSVKTYLENHSDDDTSAQARLLLAETLYKQGRFEEAGAEFQTLSASALPGKFLPNVFYKLGWCMARAGKLPEAIAAYSAFLDKFPSNDLVPSILAERGLAYQQTGEFSKALADFDQLVDKFPKAPQAEVALQQKGLIQGQLQDNKGMVATFERLLADFPKSPAAAQANYWIGWAKFEDKDYAGCLGPLGRSVELAPETYASRASLRLLLAHYYLGDVRGTVEATDRLSQMENAPPVPAEVLLWLGERLSESGDHKNAIRFLQDLVDREGPVEPPAEAWLLLANAHRATSQWEQAVAAASTFIERSTSPADKARGHLAIAQARLESGNTQAARTEAARVMQLQPEGRLNADARLLEAEIDFAEMRFADAAKAFQRVAVLYDDETIAPAALEKAYLSLKRSGNGAEADQILNELRTRFPEYKLTTENIRGIQ